MLIILLILLLLFGGGGFWYGNRTWGPRGGFGLFGAVLVILLVLYLLGGRL